MCQRNSFPILEVGNDLDVGHRENRPAPNDPRDSPQKRLRMLDVLKYLDADCFVELLVPAGKPFRSSRRSAKWQAALLQQFQAVWIHFYAGPVMPQPRSGLGRRHLLRIRRQGRNCGAIGSRGRDATSRLLVPAPAVRSRKCFPDEAACFVLGKPLQPKWRFWRSSWNKTHGYFANQIFSAIAIPRRSQFDRSIA